MEITIEKQSPERFIQTSENSWFADFGKAAYGRLEYEFETDAPAQVELVIGEVLFDPTSINRAPGGYRCIKTDVARLPAGTSCGFMSIKKHRSPYQDSYQRSKVLTPENAGGEIAPFRYAEIHGNLKSARLTRHALFAPFDDKAATFESSDDNLNKVWELCKYTMKATSAFGLYIDGERERQCFEGDAYINALGAYCTGGGYEVARRTIDFMLSFYPIPALEYRLFSPMLVRDYFLYSGDTDIYKYWRDSLRNRLVPFFIAEDGLIHFPKRIHESDPLFNGQDIEYQYIETFPDDTQLLIDWPQGERDGYEFGELNFVPHAFLHAAYTAMDKLEPNHGFARKAASLRQKSDALFRRDSGLYADNSLSSHTSIHSAMWAIAWGVAHDKDFAPLAALLKSKGMACSVYGSQFLLDALFIAGAEQAAIDLMRSEGQRSWMNMLRRGSTITMEAWDDVFKPNQDWNHAWGAAPANVIPRRLAGIRPISYGFRRFVVDPKPGDLSEFTMVHPTPHGPVSLKYSNGACQLEVPVGTEALADNRILPSGRHSFRLPS